MSEATLQESKAAQAIAECRLIASMTEEPGRITRRFLTPPVAEVHAHLRQRMTALGMIVTVDAVGNLRGLWQPPTAPASARRLILGSHIDSVPNAGAFDGVLGVVLAVHLIDEARRLALPLPIEVVAFSEEEGVRFGVPFLGSRAFTGRFDPALLALRDPDGVSMEQAIRSFGLDPGKLDDAAMNDDAIAYFELHIEQGPVLDSEGLSLAVVTGIVGQVRCEVSFTGQANHAGTTPMNLRQDALVGAAEWISAVEAAALNQPENSEKARFVATVGKISAEPNAANVIANRATVSLDVRSTSDRVMQNAVTELLDRAASIAARRGLRCQSRQQLDQPAVPMEEKLTALLEASVAEAGYPARRMPSGAGHDSLIMASRVPTAMLFLRSPGGISHHPDESVRELDVEAALSAAIIFVRRLSLMEWL
jgi:allantoate deiminase